MILSKLNFTDKKKLNFNIQGDIYVASYVCLKTECRPFLWAGVK